MKRWRAKKAKVKLNQWVRQHIYAMVAFFGEVEFSDKDPNAAELDDVSDPNLIFDLFDKLRTASIFTWQKRLNQPEPDDAVAV